MTRKIINVGVADKGNGDPIRVAFSKANDNFAELYNILSNNTGGSIITTDVIGSVFADDSTLLVDGINGSIPYSVLSGAPTIPAAQVQSNWTAASGMGVILNKPTFATVATTGAYADLTGKPTLFSGSYNDLTDKPNNIAGTYQFFVAADDSTQRTISNNESIKFTGAGGITTASDAEGNITINYVQGDIRSEGNIDIEINLSDSTLRRWQFGEDGQLTLPSGGVISEGGGLSGAIKLTPAGGANANQALLIYPTAAAEGDHIHLTAGGGSTELYLGDDFHFVKLTSDGFVVIKADDGVNGAVWGFSPDGTTSIPGNIKSDSNINIDINLSDSTLRRWQFGEDGILTLPSTGKISNSGYDWTFGSNGSLTFPNTTVQTTAWTGVVGTQATLNVTGAATAESFNTNQITVVGNRISTTVTNANLELECNGTGGVVINTLAEATTASTARSAGYLGIPASAVSTTNTLTIADAGEHIYVTTNGQTITIPANASVAYPIGTTLTFIAGPSPVVTVTIAITSDTLRLAGGTSTGTRTLAANGMATAVKVAATTWYINGTGLT